MPGRRSARRTGSSTGGAARRSASRSRAGGARSGGPAAALDPALPGEAELLDLLRGVTAAANVAATPQEALAVALERVAALTGWQLGHAFVAVEGGVLVSANVWHHGEGRYAPFRAATEPLRLTKGQGLPGRVLERGGAVWIPDLASDPEAPRAALAQAAGLRAGFAFPIAAGAEVLGVLEFYTARPRRPGPMMVAAMEQVGAQLGLVLQRQGAREDLQRVSRQHQLLLEAAGEGILGVDAEGVVRFANPALQRALGLPAEALVGRDHGEFFHLGGATEESCLLARSLRDGGRYHLLEDVLRRPDGEEVPAEFVVTAIREGPRIVGGVVVVQDLTERRRAEEALRREAALRDLLMRVALASNEARDLPHAIEATLPAVCAATGWPVGHAYVLDPGDPSRLVSSRQWHLDEPARFARFRDVTEATALRRDEGLPGTVLRERAPRWIADVTQYPNFPRNRHGPLGVRAGFAFPVLAGERVLAVLEFFHPEAQPPDQALLQTLASVGAQLGRVAERQHAAQEIQAKEARFRAVSETAHDGIVTADEEGRIVYLNAALARLVGHPPEALRGQPLEVLVPPRHRQGSGAGTLRRLLEAGGTQAVAGGTVELAGLRKDGSEFPLELSLSAWDEGGQRRYTAIVRDITDRRRAERELQKKAEELARSNRELEQFAYVASHDLQEPLRMVASYVQLLQRRYQGRLDADADEFIQFAVEGATRMQALINALLAYSRVGRRGKPPGPTDLEAVLAQALQNLRPLLEQHGAVVTHDPLPTVLGDDTQLLQLFQNLVQNAVKFRGPDPPRVHVGAERNEIEWRFTVRDNGIGIDPAYHDRIFVIFQRLHTRDQFEGTGIGLSLCKKIVERRGGTIRVDSASGQGAVFTFTIPHLGAEEHAT